MSITSRLFQKAVKVLRGGLSKKNRRKDTIEDAAPYQGAFFEAMESRLLMSTVTIAALADAAEGGADGSFRITRDDTLGDLVVKFSRKGTASFGATKDYTLSDGVNDLTTSVVIPDGQAFVDVTVLVNNDALAEVTETIILNLSSGSGYTLSPDLSTRTANINLTDDEPTVSITATDGLASENVGETGSFTITRVGNTVGDLVVNFKRVGNATFGKDYGLTVNGLALTTSSVTILDGDASVVIVVVPIDDTKVENTETVGLTLKTSSLFKLDPQNGAAVAITDNEPVIFTDPTSSAPTAETITNNNNLGADSFIITGTESLESHDAGPPFFQFVRDGSVVSGRALEVRNADGVNEAFSRKAYVSFDLSLFTANLFSNAIFTLTLIDIQGDSPNNTNFTFDVFGIRDDFVPGAGEQDEDWNEDINLNDAPANGGGGGTVDLPDVFRGAPLGSFDIVGTGTVGQQVSISGQTLTDFLNAETTLDADGDTLVTFIIVRRNVGDAATDTVIHGFDGRDDTFGDATTLPQLTAFGEAAGVAVTEGDNGTVRIFRTGNTDGDVTVNFRLSGSARLGIDYQLEVDGAPVTNSFVIPDGQSFIDITIITLDDAIFEIPESVTITMRSSDAYALQGQGTAATVSITDNEPVVTITATDDIAREPDLTTLLLNTGTYTISRTGSTAADLTVNVRFSGQAKDGKDFTAIGRTIVIPAGSASVAVTISPFADNIPEGDEDVILSIVPSSAYGLTWLVNGTLTSTGSAVRPTAVAAASMSQARQRAKDLGIGGARVIADDQSDIVTIRSGTVPPGPDLVPVNFKLIGTTRDNDIIGGTFGTATVRNQGTTGVAGFNVRFVLSTDNVLSGLDTELSIQTITSLGAGAEVSVSIIFGDLSALAPGNYFIIMDVDNDDVIGEFIENNNTLSTVLNQIVIVD